MRSGLVENLRRVICLLWEKKKTRYQTLRIESYTGSSGRVYYFLLLGLFDVGWEGILVLGVQDMGIIFYRNTQHATVEKAS